MANIKGITQDLNPLSCLLQLFFGLKVPFRFIKYFPIVNYELLEWLLIEISMKFLFVMSIYF